MLVFASLAYFALGVALAIAAVWMMGAKIELHRMDD